MCRSTHSFFVSIAFFAILSSCVAAVDAEASWQPDGLRRPWLDGVPTPLPLLSKKRISRDVTRYRFGLTPVADDSDKSSSSPRTMPIGTPNDKSSASSRTTAVGTPNDFTLGIPICSCLLVSPPSDSSLTRPYTPISSRHEQNQFDLLVKHYPDGRMGSHFRKLRKGDCMTFRQIPKNIKIQYPFGHPKTIIMLAAGTGITPMFQALQHLFGSDEDDADADADGEDKNETNVILMYGSRTRRDIYLRKELNDMQKRHPHRLTVIHCLSDDNRAKSKENECVVSGPIDKATIALMCREEIFGKGKGKSKSTACWVCGPPRFYTDVCGPRDEEGVLSDGCILKELGFREKDVVKF